MTIKLIYFKFQQSIVGFQMICLRYDMKYT